MWIVKIPSTTANNMWLIAEIRNTQYLISTQSHRFVYTNRIIKGKKLRKSDSLVCRLVIKKIKNNHAKVFAFWKLDTEDYALKPDSTTEISIYPKVPKTRVVT